MTRQKDHSSSVEKISFRLFPPYTERVATIARTSQLSPNQLARIATMSMADNGLLNLSERMCGVERELRKLRLQMSDSGLEDLSPAH